MILGISLIVGYVLLLIAAIKAPLLPKSKLKPHEYKWGDGTDLSALAVRHNLPLPNSPFEELEKWWFREQSKDAEIKRAEEKITSLKAELEQYQDKSSYSLFGYSKAYDYADVVHKQRNMIQELTEKLNQQTTDINDAFLERYDVPTHLVDDPRVITAFTFRGKELIEWHQSHNSLIDIREEIPKTIDISKKEFPKERKSQWSSTFF